MERRWSFPFDLQVQGALVPVAISAANRFKPGPYEERSDLERAFGSCFEPLFSRLLGCPFSNDRDLVSLLVVGFIHKEHPVNKDRQRDKRVYQ